MRKLSIHIFCVYFLLLGLSDLWGGHVHHTGNHGADKLHLENHSESKHHHEKLKEVASQDHCVQHCSVENILEHLLEDKTFSNVDVFDFGSKQCEGTTLAFSESPLSPVSKSLYDYSSTIPPPFESQWATITTSPRPPPFLS